MAIISRMRSARISSRSSAATSGVVSSRDGGRRIGGGPSGGGAGGGTIPYNNGTSPSSDGGRGTFDELRVERVASDGEAGTSTTCDGRVPYV